MSRTSRRSRRPAGVGAKGESGRGRDVLAGSRNNLAAEPPRLGSRYVEPFIDCPSWRWRPKTPTALCFARVPNTYVHHGPGAAPENPARENYEFFFFFSYGKPRRYPCPRRTADSMARPEKKVYFFLFLWKSTRTFRFAKSRLRRFLERSARILLAREKKKVQIGLGQLQLRLIVWTVRRTA